MTLAMAVTCHQLERTAKANHTVRGIASTKLVSAGFGGVLQAFQALKSLILCFLWCYAALQLVNTSEVYVGVSNVAAQQRVCHRLVCNFSRQRVITLLECSLVSTVAASSMPLARMTHPEPCRCSIDQSTL